MELEEDSSTEAELRELLDSAELLERSSTVVDDDNVSEELLDSTALETSRLSLLCAADDDVAASVLESVELLEMTDEDVSGIGGSQILSPEHAAKAKTLAATKLAAIFARIFFNSQTIKPNIPLSLITLHLDFQEEHGQSHLQWLESP